MEDSDLDVEDMCADLTSEIEDMTLQCQALGYPVDVQFQSKFHSDLANSLGQATLKILRARKRYLCNRLKKIASNVKPPLLGRELASPSPASGGAPHLPAREPVVAHAEKNLGLTVPFSNRPGPSTKTSVKLEAANDDDSTTRAASTTTCAPKPRLGRPNIHGCRPVY